MNHVFHAPQGFSNLRKDVDYVLLRNRPDQSAMAVWFDQRRNAHLEFITQARLVEGLADKKILKKNDIWSLPPWLEDLRGVTFDHLAVYVLEEGKRGRTHSDHVDHRVALLQPALDNIAHILAARDPDKVLNEIARTCIPAQNERRFRNWFYTYIACGYNRWSLLPPMFEAGKWDRSAEKHQGKKFGRSSKAGAQHGHGCTEEMAAACVEGFKKCARVGTRLAEVYRDIMEKVFGCKAMESDGKAYYTHPEGSAFPTYWQFRYHCEKALTRPVMRAALKSDQAYRNEDAPSMGRYSSELTNLNERSRSDACWSKDFPRSHTSAKSIGSKLCMVELFDDLSGVCTGIGFSVKGESVEAYKAAYFCMAIPKSRFGEIIGVPISDDEWPGHGIPSEIFTDRGPGKSKKIGLPCEMSRGQTPGYTPQSNATVESRHTRQSKATGAPSHTISDLTPIAMAKWEVLNAIKKNNHSSASDRVDYSMIALGICSPMGIWRDLDGRMRNDASPISFDEAVKRFLMKVKFQVAKGRLMLHGFEYGSLAFEQTATFQRLRRLEGTELDGYVLEIAVRKAWIVVDQRIVEVDVRLPFRSEDAEVALSLPELKALGKAKASQEYQRKQELPAAGTLMRQRFTKETGRQWDGKKMRAGRAPVTSAQAKKELNTLGARQ